MAFKFEKLAVWQKALALSGKINSLTKTFPDTERFVLASQLQRAADSIALNIAEGSTGQTTAEFKHFLSYALRSALEVVACLYLGKERSVVKEGQFSPLYEETETLVRMIQALRRSLR